MLPKGTPGCLWLPSASPPLSSESQSISQGSLVICQKSHTWPAEPLWLWPGMLGTGQVSGMFPRQNVKKRHQLLTARGSLCVSLGALKRFRTDPNLFGARRLWFLFERRKTHHLLHPPAGGGVWLGAAWLPSNARWESWGLGVLEVSWQRQPTAELEPQSLPEALASIPCSAASL